MKLAILFPGYLDSPDYLHIKTFSDKLKEIGYVTEVLDPCNLWKSNNIENYTVSNYLKDIKTAIESYKNKQPDEIVLIGHSLGGFTAILAGHLYQEVTKIIALCPPVSIDKLGSKWINKKPRISKRDLPNDPSKFRHFEVPYSFVEDAKKYSSIEALRQINKQLMIFIGLKDTSVLPDETEILVSNANSPFVVRMENVGHDFRKSLAETNLVLVEIEKFLKK